MFHENTWYITMLGLVKKLFIGFLSVCTVASFWKSINFNSEGPIKSVSLNNQQCQTIPTFADINSNETLFYPFTMRNYVFQIK